MGNFVNILTKFLSRFKLVDIPKPKAWPPPSLKDSDGVQKLLTYGYERDPVGDKIHTKFACLFLFCLPLATAPANISMGILFVHSLLRLPTTWRTLTPLLKSSVYWSILAWVLFSTLSIAWSSDKTMGWDHASSMWWMAIPIPILLWPILRKWKWLLAAGLIGVFLQNTLQISELIGSWFLDGDDWISIVKNKFREDKIVVYFSRPIGLDNHQGNGSLFIACTIFIWLGVFLNNKCKPTKIWFVAIAAATTGLVIAQSRAVLIGFSAALILFLYISIRKNLISLTTIAKMLIPVVIVFSAGIMVQSNLASSLYHRIMEIPEATRAYFVDGTVDTGIDERLNWYSTELKNSFESPLAKNTIVGHGLGSTTEIDFSLEGQTVAKTTVHPHNAFIQILFEGGVLGLGLFCWLLVKIILVARAQTDNTNKAVAFACITLWVIAAFFDGGQNSGRVLALLMIIMVVCEFHKRVCSVECTMELETTCNA